MSTETPAPAETTYAIAYQPFVGAIDAVPASDRGTLTIQTAEPRFVFTARIKGTRFFRARDTLALSSAEIGNVAVEGHRVQFLADLRSIGEKSREFTFFAATPAQARAIAAALPATQDTAYVEGRDFARRLAQVSGPAGTWNSVTNLIIAANVAVFVAMGLAGAGWFGVQDMTPYLDFGANRGDLTTDGEWWRLASSMFLHFGLLHLLLNMWALLSTGHLVERLFGRTLFAIAYLGSGIAGSVASLLWHGTAPVWSAGASGAIFGVYGALLGFMLREKNALPKSVFSPLLNSTLFFAGYNLLYGAAKSGIDNAAHIGGFAGGFVLGWLLALPLDRSLRTHAMPGRAFLGLAGTLVFIGVGIGFAPHFPYRLVDELAWEKAIKDPAAREQAIDTAERQAIADFKFTANNANLLAWLGNEGIPFYRDWSDQLAKLSLDPHRITARRRDALLVAVRLKLASYEHLRDALVRRDPAALVHFQEDEEAVSAANARLGAVDK